MVVRVLESLGALCVGKANLDCAACGLNGTRSLFPGPCRNSIYPEYISGGSSSGSAVPSGVSLTEPGGSGVGY